MDGRGELQRVILHYEKQRAEAIRAKQEAEIVLPFVRAALEELDAATGQSESGEVMERVQAQLESARSPQAQVASVPTPFGANDGRSSIASLIEDTSQEQIG